MIEMTTFDTLPVRVERPTPSPQARFQAPWVPFPEGVEAIKTMKALIGRPNEGRPLNFALIGDPNFGKSHLLDYFVDHYPEVDYEETTRLQIVRLDMPAKADGSALVREILRAMGAPYVRKEPLDEMIAKVIGDARMRRRPCCTRCARSATARNARSSWPARLCWKMSCATTHSSTSDAFGGSCRSGKQNRRSLTC